MAEKETVFGERTAKKLLWQGVQLVALFGTTYAGASAVQDYVASNGGDPEQAATLFKSAAIGVGAVILAAPKTWVNRGKVLVAGTVGSLVLMAGADMARQNPEPWRNTVGAVDQGVDWVRGLAGPSN